MYFDNIKIENNIPNFGRSYENTIDYTIHKNISKEFNINLLNILFDEYESYKIKLNRFPYQLNDAKHYLIWFHPKYNWIDNEKLVSIILDKHFICKNKKIKVWENAKHLRTILNIRHLHVIVQN